MFGTDLPVWQAHEDCSLTRRYRAYAEAFRAAGLERSADAAFRGFAAEAKGYSVSSECGSRRKGMMPMKVMPFSSRQGFS